MSKGLEALEEIKSELRIRCASWKWVDDLAKPIEKELKEYEEMKRIKGTTTLDSALEETLIKTCPSVAKKLKALEIIKEKPQATLWLIQHCDKEMEYEDMLFLFKEDITKEQFDLLKEVLL